MQVEDSSGRSSPHIVFNDFFCQPSWKVQLSMRILSEREKKLINYNMVLEISFKLTHIIMNKAPGSRKRRECITRHALNTSHYATIIADYTRYNYTIPAVILGQRKCSLTHMKESMRQLSTASRTQECPRCILSERDDEWWGFFVVDRKDFLSSSPVSFFLSVWQQWCKSFWKGASAPVLTDLWIWCHVSFIMCHKLIQEAVSTATIFRCLLRIFYAKLRFGSSTHIIVPGVSAHYLGN